MVSPFLAADHLTPSRGARILCPLSSGDSDDDWSSCLSVDDLNLIASTKSNHLSDTIRLVHSGHTSQRCRNLCARMATSRGSLDLMKFLFQNHAAAADVHSRSKRGYTPMRLARIYQNQEAIEYLRHTLGVREEEDDDDDESSNDRNSNVHNDANASVNAASFDFSSNVASPAAHSSPVASDRTRHHDDDDNDTRHANDTTTPKTTPKGFKFLNKFSPILDRSSRPKPPSPPAARPSLEHLASRDDVETALASVDDDASIPIAPSSTTNGGVALQTCMKPISTANSRMRHRFDSNRNVLRTFEPMMKSQGEDEEGDHPYHSNGMTFVSTKRNETDKAIRKERPDNDESNSTHTHPHPTDAAAPAIPCAPPLTDYSSNIPIPPPLFGGIPGAPPMAPSFGPSSSSSSNLTRRVSRLKPSVPLKSLHWDVIDPSNEGGKKTVWNELAEKEQSEIDDDLETHAQQLEALFSKKTTSTTMTKTNRIQSTKNVTSSSSSSSSSSVSSNIIDLKRSNNIEIAIKRFRLTWFEIVRSILEVDWKILTMDRLQALMNCLPTNEEIVQLQTAVETFKRNDMKMEPIVNETSKTSTSASSNNTGTGTNLPNDNLNYGYPSFNYAENFFYHLSTVPRCSTRLKLLMFVQRFEGQVHDVETSLKTITSVVTSIRMNRCLKQLIDIVLVVGNFMNSGTRKGSARGFKIGSLHLLGTTKSNDGKSSLLDYIVKHIDDRYVFKSHRRQGSLRSSPTTTTVESEPESDRDTEETNLNDNEANAAADSARATSVPSFLESLSLVKSASLIDFGHIEREVTRMESSLKLVKLQLAHAPPTTTTAMNDNSTVVCDRFTEVLHDFYESSFIRFETLQTSLHETLSNSSELITYFGEPSPKITSDHTMFYEQFAKFIDTYKMAESNSRQKRQRETIKKVKEEEKMMRSSAHQHATGVRKDTAKTLRSRDEHVDGDVAPIHIAPPTSTTSIDGTSCESVTLVDDHDVESEPSSMTTGTGLRARGHQQA